MWWLHKNEEVIKFEDVKRLSRRIIEEVCNEHIFVTFQLSLTLSSEESRGKGQKVMKTVYLFVENLCNKITLENHTLYEDIYRSRSLSILYRQVFIEAAILSSLIGYCFGER